MIPRIAMIRRISRYPSTGGSPSTVELPPLVPFVTGRDVELVVNWIDSDTAFPAMVTDPEARLAVKPETVPTVNSSVPFAAWNTIDEEVEARGVPFNVTVQVVPTVSPVSENVTGNFV
jgi:hypothetical protein